MTRGRPARATHGDYGYANKQKCTCEPCLVARRRYQKRLAFDHAQGGSRRVDVTPVREHLQMLMDAGLSIHQIASATNPTVFASTIYNILYGNRNTGRPVEWLRNRDTADRLLAVTYEAAAAIPALVPMVGVHRRIQALAYMGHSKTVLARELGITESAVHDYMKRDTCLSSTVAEIHEVYQRLAMVHGDSERLRWQSRKRGWMPPMAWDEDTIDDPDAEPDLASVVCIVDECSRHVLRASLCRSHYNEVCRRGGFGQRSQRYREAVLALGKRAHNDPTRLRADLMDLYALGYTRAQAAVRLGRTESAIERVWRSVRDDELAIAK